MGKGGKGGNSEPEKRKKMPEPESSEQEEVDEDQFDELGEDGEEDDEEMDYLDAEISDRDQQLLDRINQEIQAAEEPLKLTWAAIHKLKQEEKQLNEKMDEQMRKIQQKFEVMKVPLVNKIAKIVSGQAVEKELYTQHQMTKALNVNKHKPIAIPGFWRQTFQSAHFIAGEVDTQILEHCTKVECDSTSSGQGQNEEQTIKVIFQFSENPIISNKQLKAVVHRKGNVVEKKEQTIINFKKQEPKEKSSFLEIFGKETTPEELYSACSDIQRIYNNCVFHFFFTGQIEGQQNEHAIEDAGQGEDDDEDSEQDIKPVKKKPLQSETSKGKTNQPPTQKPDCKNQ